MFDLATALAAAAVTLLLSMVAGFWRITVGPAPADRMVGVQMSGTAAIALLLLMAEWLDQPALRDVALLLALLAAAITAALVQILRRASTSASATRQNKEFR